MCAELRGYNLASFNISDGHELISGSSMRTVVLDPVSRMIVIQNRGSDNCAESDIPPVANLTLLVDRQRFAWCVLSVRWMLGQIELRYRLRLMPSLRDAGTCQTFSAVVAMGA